MEKVPEFRNDFRNDIFPENGNFRNVVPELRIVTEFRNVQEISGTFRNIVPEIFRKIVPEISGFRNNRYHNYINVLHM